MIVNKVAVIGSRDFKFKKTIEAYLSEIIPEHNIKNTIFISGGAKGVDTEIENYCKEYNFSFWKIRPIDPSNKIDYLFRNVEIITLANELIIFWDGKSKGTKFVIDYAKARNKDMTIIKEVI